MDWMFDTCFKEGWLLEKKEIKNVKRYSKSLPLFAFFGMHCKVLGINSQSETLTMHMDRVQ